MGNARLLGYDKQIVSGDPEKPIMHRIELAFLEPNPKISLFAQKPSDYNALQSIILTVAMV